MRHKHLEILGIHVVKKSFFFLFRSDSKDITHDMWISDKDFGKELEPLNT
jgi:hypothetical protein